VRFSVRSTFPASANRLAAEIEALRRRGAPLLDLSESNPTRVGLTWPPEELAAILGDPTCARYDPDPLGPQPAREAVSRYLEDLGVSVATQRIVLTASTSEAYLLLLKLLCDPGEEVLIPAPSYPLHEVLCQLEGVHAARYPLRWDGSWHVDLPALRAAVTERTRALVAVSPANPTGAVLSREELDALESVGEERGVALIGDEVFADTALTEAPSVASVRRCLAAHLGGLSKTCGLPQIKGAWIALSGPGNAVGAALERLEMIGDASLSLSAPAALAIARLLPARESFLARLRARLAHNERTLRDLVPAGAPFDVLTRAGNWSAVLRIAERLDEEQLCLDLLHAGVVVQPGFFYDFERSGYLVVSLLPEEDVFGEGAALLVPALTAHSPH